MLFKYHGGQCCGIKHIQSMGPNPDREHGAFDVTSFFAAHYQTPPYAVSTRKGAKFPNPEPRETGYERLDRYLRYFDSLYPSGIVEVVLAESEVPYLNQMAWVPALEERGFREVNSNLNSNSGNIVHIYHRNTVEGVVKS